ncbi:MAG: HAD-IA family hydrolase [Pseudomonadota bacterium]
MSNRVDLSRIKALSFDLDDTLWAIMPIIHQAEKASRDWLLDHYPDTASFFATQSVLSLREAVLADYPDRHHDLSFLRKECIGRVLEDAGYTREGVDGAFEAFCYARNTIELFDDVVPFFDEFASRYVFLALTNGNASVARTPLKDTFDTYLNAIKVGAAKPEPIMFETALAAHTLAPDEMLHIGDDLYSDVQGAAQLAIPTVWVNRFGRPWLAESDVRPDFVINSLTQLGHILAATEQR